MAFLSLRLYEDVTIYESDIKPVMLIFLKRGMWEGTQKCLHSSSISREEIGHMIFLGLGYFSEGK